MARKRREDDEVEALWAAFRRIYRSGEPKRRSLLQLKSDPAAPDLVRELVESLERTDLGLKGCHRESMRAEFERLGRERLSIGVGG